MFFHSCSFMFFHFLSFSFIFVHLLSFSFIFHFLSFSFIFFHFLSFSFIVFVFVGCSKSFFGCLNFVKISLDSSHVKNQFWGPSRVVKGNPFGPSFPFFPTFFYRFFLSFFLLFIFTMFSLFLFISSFFDFLLFFIFFFHFFRRKSFFFSFSCISFKYFLLLALVSEFNCFLRSRCSMEMWCPDDLRRDSRDWVGPPAWERACFNSPEWSGGSSPVKTEPPQILLLLLFQTHMKVCVCAQHLKPACSYKLIENVQT